MERKNCGIIFFGTPEFAALQLEHLIESGFNILAAVTAPDKPSGRGKKISSSAVKITALKHGIPLLQPLKLKDEDFINALQQFQADLFIVIAFRMLPELVWQMPPLGTFNLHASLLPQYRGAAPINRAIMNGETKTGLTCFFINANIDEGNIILQKEMPIGENENAGELHDRMITEGKELIVQTINQISSQTVELIDQSKEQHQELKPAPKLFKSDCKIQWDKSGNEIRNQIRGLSPYPTAFTQFKSANGEEVEVKLFSCSFQEAVCEENPFTLLTDNKSFLKVALADGYLYINILQQSGKKALKVDEYLRGFRFDGHWYVS